ncbi:SDR family oxidoreductase [Roseibacterium beibuensis]|uniref:SDR family NAD(P)-dependent oxidoreductase n=1 Tax=[Roseibacterium] beibuensis TaxID=1193142 RepID=UPI00217E4B7F|nr:SDR family oxidoreductase [Roseibacterium beibuensis]MCS6624662.1 SDR family oxidoreductase [Roseibacterium beibuensis]
MTDLSTTAAEAVRPLAVVTGASSGIGYELARLFAEEGHDLVVAADRPLAEAVQTFESLGARVDAVQADLATERGVQSLYACIGSRPVDALAANAGHGLGHAFLDQDFDEIRSKVAKIGYEAMKRGDGDVVAGMGNKLQAAMAAVTTESALAEMHRKQAEPGSGKG